MSERIEMSIAIEWLILGSASKKTDLSTITNEQLQEVVLKINNLPRKVLNYQTSEEVFMN